ncbi:MAG: glycerol-3-phosphate dehydrogenase/oxidase [Gemmatimonadaceae bacterium]
MAGVSQRSETRAAERARQSAAEARASALDELATTTFDVLVVGGGITGAGIARDAAMRGLSVALVDRSDFASGTSSRSSRLIHGGVRYLEHGHFHLVFEASRERRTLLRIAPHLVRSLPFMWPVYRGARLSRWKLGIGLFVYDALALFRNIRNHQRLDARTIERLEPGLRTADLQGGARYYDAATDDIRLTIANVRAAAEAGAVALNHVEISALSVDDPAIAGVTAEDRLGGRTIPVRARVVVNATGPWSDRVRGLAASTGAAGVRGSKGVHVSVPRDRIGNLGAITLISPIDGRVMFVLPAGPNTIIGTTDTEYAGDPQEVRATMADVAYLLRSANAFFPSAHLTMDDVVSAWAGVRPLAAPAGRVSLRDPDSASREHSLDWTAPGLLTITGGKLTTYRAMAAEVVQAVARHLRDAPRRRAATDHEPLPGGIMRSFADEIDSARATIGDQTLADHLVHAYGGEWYEVWSHAEADSGMAERLAHPLPYIAAELRFAVDRALAMTLSDVMMRRLHIAFESRDHGRSAAPAIAARLAPMLEWDDAETARQLAAYEADTARIFTIER